MLRLNPSGGSMNDAQISQPHFHFRLLPFIVAVLLAFGLPYVASEVVDSARHYSHLVPGFADTLRWTYAQHTVWVLLAVAAIAIAVRVVPADYGLHMPQEKSYLLPAIFWGVIFGVLMAGIANAPSILAHTAPKLGYPRTAGYVFGWLGFNGLYAGPTEEVPFRALIVTYLATTMPGTWRVRGYGMNAAGVVAAAIWAFYMAGFTSQPLAIAIGQLVFQFALGILYAYWLEKSKSVLAPIVGHNISGATQYVLLLLMATMWA
jgi:hypothetical protein